MNTTPYYSLGKPLSTEKYSVSVQNTNMDLIDTALNELDLKVDSQSNAFDDHIENVENPHNVTKAQIGLGNVENKSSATIRSELTKDNVVNALGYTPYTKNEVDNKLSALESAIDWKEAVETYDDIAVTYPEPEDGWTVNVNDTDYTYRYNGEEWIVISANAIPKATASVDGLLSKEDYVNYEDAYSKKHTHDNKDVIDSITQDMIDKWNEGATSNSNYTQGRCVVVGQYGIYYSNSDDDSYNMISSENGNFNAIVYAEEQNRFVAVKNSASIVYSSDGKNWTSVDLTSQIQDYGHLNDVTYGNGHFVCVGDLGNILYSEDAITWYCASGHNTATTAIYRSVCYGNNRFVTVGHNGLSYYSTNAQTWYEMSGTDSNAGYHDVAYGNGRFVCLGGSTSKCYYCTDGVTWQPSEFTQSANSIAYGNGTFIIAGQNCNIFYSNDGVEWNEVTVDGLLMNFSKVTYANDMFWGITATQIYYSIDGITWTVYKNCTSIRDLAYLPAKSNNLMDYVTKTELKEYAQPIIKGSGLTKITYSATEPETIEEGEIVFVYER